MTVLLPSSLDDALAGVSDPDVSVLAGGTDFMVEVNAGRRRPDTVLYLGRVGELRTFTVDDTSVRLGATVTYTEMLQPPLAGALPALAQAARTVGSPQIRNAGTIGGNLGTASPAGDTIPVLAALEAVVEVASASGRRDIPIEDFIVGAKRNALQPGELIVAVRVPRRPGYQEFRKVGVRNAMVISVASLALVLDTDRRRVRCALGSVGPGPVRATEAEEWLAAELDWDQLTAQEAPDLAHFGRLVAAAARPIDDHRGTADYRRHAVGVLAARAAAKALAAPGLAA